ncbi:MAG: hypothetical protein DRI90_06890 [Deltaproteobacteria bacterium]|nr:MAG: hypothetical protein DRI90_06890 [Deltaproteobacteria bacterium]
MTQGMQDPLESHKPGRSWWRILAVVLGLALAAAGVVLIEAGHSSGRNLIFLGLPITIVALLVGVLRRSQGPASEAVVTASVWVAMEQVAEREGFDLAPGRVAGTLKGHQVEATAEEPAGPVMIRCHADRQLDLGLVVARERPPGDARQDVAVGDDHFDEAYCVKVDEPERGRAILTERLRSLLLQMDARLDDSGVTLSLTDCNAASLYAAMRYAARVTSELDRASGGVACAKLLASARDSWLAFAQEHSLASADTPLAMWGEIAGLDVSAVAIRDAFKNFHYELTASFAEDLGRGLELRPASSTTRFDQSGEPVGHPAFDKIFVLKSRDALDATRLVGGETRNAMLELRDWGLQLRVRDTGLWAWVGFDPTNAEVVPKGLARMALVTKRIADNAERFPSSQREPAGEG